MQHNTWTYTYDANGMRISRSGGVDIYKYVYNGDQLVQMSKLGHTLKFYYDAGGAPVMVLYKDRPYYYVTNLQGDTIMLLDADGEMVVDYTVDAWGRVYAIGGTMASTLGVLNPLIYRGYVYDHETGLYYLNSRYYDPEIGRFINADVLISTGQGLLGNNMFAYCRNNPVMRADATGTFDKEAFDIDGDPTRDEKDVITSASTGFAKADIIIYRYGGTNPGNLTPRSVDVNSGLSFSTEYRPGAAKTTISAVNSTGILFAYKDGPTHVTVMPKNASMLAWYEAGSSSEWTLALKSVVTKAK